jgi:hypothetical protein
MGGLHLVMMSAVWGQSGHQTVKPQGRLMTPTRTSGRTAFSHLVPCFLSPVRKRPL